MNSNTILCPKCNTPISIDEALGHQIEASIKLQYEKQSQEEVAEVRRKAKEWQETKEKEFAEQEKSVKLKIEENLRKELLQEAEVEQKQLKEELVMRKKQLQESKERELVIMKKQEELEEKEKNLELEMKRQMAEERQKISDQAEKRVKDEFQLSLAEKDKMLSDAIKANEELKQKLTQGSQQMQGEILELELENLLKAEFPVDDILPVGKGINGADVMQKVRDQNGRECGVIIWESKRTKHWDDKWVPKLKDDMRSSKSDLAILVTTALPQGLTNFGPKDGIYVTSFDNFLAVAKIMRLKIIEVCYAKMASEGVNDKKEILWKYLTGNEFKQRVESIVETFNALKDGLEMEKKYFAKKWARDEKLIDNVVNQTVGMHGDLQGLMGASLPQIKSLEFDNFELISTSEVMITSGEDTVVQTTISQTVIEEVS